ncbi:ATP-binding protein [Bradyrhizobium sp. 186]|uniref:ATP-binding protein n=1 Tax=Bradyrhizobium sp. 186 TaxID=2782654 RepID=UPI003211AAD0
MDSCRSSSWRRIRACCCSRTSSPQSFSLRSSSIWQWLDCSLPPASAKLRGRCLHPVRGALRRAIEPFFSTKVPGRGSGLGLPIVRAIVKQSGGHFSIQSKPGCGTTVDMWLPVAEEVGAIGVAA